MLSRFQTAKEKEERDNRTKRIFSIIVVLILALSTAGFALLSSSERQNEGNAYYDFDFSPTNEGWQTSVGGYYILTQYLPQDVEYINHSGMLNKDDFQGIVYFVTNTESETQTAKELSRLITAVKKDYACLPENQGEECLNKSIKSCGDATRIQKIIIFNETESNGNASVIYENNCLLIQGNSEELIRATDKAIFLLFGVIKQ